MKFKRSTALMLTVLFTACSGKHPAVQNGLVDALNKQVKDLAAENDDLKHRLSTVQEPRGLTNAQIIHQQMRNMRIAGLLRDGRSAVVLEFLEGDLPSFVDFYRKSGSFSQDDIWTLHEIRDYYKKYRLPVSADMSTALPTPYLPCDGSTVPTEP